MKNGRSRVSESLETPAACAGYRRNRSTSALAPRAPSLKNWSPKRYSSLSKSSPSLEVRTSR